MRSAAIIREARLRAGLTQGELAERTGRERSVIARWEQGAVAPSVDTLLGLVEACGFDLPLELVPAEPVEDERLRKNLLLSPERQVQRALRQREKALPKTAAQPPFDPYAILAAPERRRVAYVLIGAFARVIRGADELTDGVDITPSLREVNLGRLLGALADLGAERADRKALAFDEGTMTSERLIRLRSPHGELGIVLEPAGTRRGYDDLRRAATREHLGHGVRPPVASTADLARMLAALDRQADLPKLRAMRRLTELEHSPGHELGL